MKVLITLGPTQEPIDDIRYVTNASSGKMGAALAREALARGHATSIVAGPVSIALPDGAKVIRVRTAAEMTEESLKELKGGYDVFVSTAAIADYSPLRVRGKIRSDAKELVVKMRQNPKLTKLAKKEFPALFVAAFKAEHGVTEEKLTEAAWKKISAEKLDLVVASDVKKHGFGSEKTEMSVVDRRGEIVYIPKDSKDNIASRIWDRIEEARKRDEREN